VAKVEQNAREESALEATGCRLIPLGGSSDARGDLTFLEGEHDVPFAIRRLFYIRNVANGQRRADHAHLNAHQAVIAVTGSFEAVVDVATHAGRITLDRPDRVLQVPPLTWLTLESFSPDAVCLVLSSHSYSPEDYCRDYEEFVQARRLAP
jgi:hypothetical protein